MNPATLVDTSIWVEHFRQPCLPLVDFLAQDLVLMHPYVTGELACGNLKDRRATSSGDAALAGWTCI